MGTSAMRETEASFWMMQKTSLTRAMRLAAIALGVGLVMATGPVRAGDDDEEDDRTFEEKIIHNIMTGLGGTNMETKGIEYRERSPLVVPPKIDLPPPAASNEVKAPNWPKDPDEARRKAAIAARKKDTRKSVEDPRTAFRPLTPEELSVGGKTAAVASASKDKANDPVQPGTSQNNPILSPSQLGFSGSLGSLMLGGNKPETAPFKGEPERQTLTQPPPGYQTPSPNFAYGTGPKESLNKEYNPAAGKYGD
jgi:hypothetical protein